MEHEQQMQEGQQDVSPESKPESAGQSNPSVEVPETLNQPVNTGVPTAGSSDVLQVKPLSGGDVTYAEATADKGSLTNESAFLPFEEGQVRGRVVPFVLNDDPDRPVKVIQPKHVVTIKFGRNSASKSEGLFVGRNQIEGPFPMRFNGLQHKKQVTFVTTDGTEIIGYIFVTDSRKGVYVPKKLTGGIQLPPMGKTLPVKVAKIILG